MKTVITGLTALAMIGMGAGAATAAPASVQREDGPCYPQYEHDSADGKLSCSGEDGIWISKALSKAPKVALGAACPTLGARAKTFQNHGVVECQRTENGLRWKNIR